MKARLYVQQPAATLSSWSLHKLLQVELRRISSHHDAFPALPQTEAPPVFDMLCGRLVYRDSMFHLQHALEAATHYNCCAAVELVERTVDSTHAVSLRCIDLPQGSPALSPIVRHFVEDAVCRYNYVW